nr:hypothetical protein [uncultured Acetatifactor sp.]
MLVKEGFLDDVSARADYLWNRLQTMPGVTGISGIGLMIGVSVDEGLDARNHPCGEGHPGAGTEE